MSKSKFRIQNSTQNLVLECQIEIGNSNSKDEIQNFKSNVQIAADAVVVALLIMLFAEGRPGGRTIKRISSQSRLDKNQIEVKSN